MRQFELATLMGLQLVEIFDETETRGLVTCTYQFIGWSRRAELSATEYTIAQCEDRVATDFFKLLADGIAYIQELDR